MIIPVVNAVQEAGRAGKMWLRSGLQEHVCDMERHSRWGTTPCM